jgi:hypothetical protein
MPNDAKLGLICGVGVVVVVSFVFFRNEGSGARLEGQASAAAFGAPKAVPAAASSNLNRSVKTKSPASSEGGASALASNDPQKQNWSSTPASDSDAAKVKTLPSLGSRGPRSKR